MFGNLGRNRADDPRDRGGGKSRKWDPEFSVILRRLASFSAAQADPRRDYLTPECFDNLGKLLLLMSLLWFYFIFTERLTTWYGNARSGIAVLWLTQRGPYRQLFWAMLCCNFVIPFPLLAIKKLRTIAGTLLHQSR